MTIFILGMNHLQYLVCLDAKILSFHRRPFGEKALSRFHMCTDSSQPSSLSIVLSWNFMISDPGVGMLINAKKVFPFHTCRKVWLHCLKTDHMAYKPSSKYVVGTSSMRASSKGVKRLQLWQLFSVDEGRERIQIPFFSGPSSARQRNAI